MRGGPLACWLLLALAPLPALAAKPHPTDAGAPGPKRSTLMPPRIAPSTLPPPPAPPAAPVPKTPATRAAVTARLHANEPALSQAAWRPLGTSADRVLIQIGGDTKEEILIRTRAVSALAAFPNADARKFLEATVDANAAASKPDERLLLRKATVALGWIGGSSVPARIAPLLDHADPDVRLDAAIALGLTRAEAAADPLRRRFEKEPVAPVRAQIGRQLRIIEDALAAAAPAKP